MKKNFELSGQAFDNLLDWLASDRDEAGQKYEQIRAGLIKFFRFRGCSGAADLADETINRVAQKIETLTLDENVKALTIFYGFASNIYMEYVTQSKMRELPYESNTLRQNERFADIESDEDNLHACLENCLKKLAAEESELVIRYYSEEKQARISLREDLARRMKMSMGALHTKVYRIRNTLKPCLQDCLDGK
jgi:DNA-directed RNA polymerase specialized sigma24 family protein